MDEEKLTRCPYCDKVFLSQEELRWHVLRHDITWNHFREEGKFRFIYEDAGLESLYEIRKLDSHLELVIRDRLTSSPMPGAELDAKLAAVNSHRRFKGLADRQTTGGGDKL